jgi:hypothetical protein
MGKLELINNFYNGIKKIIELAVLIVANGI